ncbi:ATP-grasp domain-containing protein [Mediterraneibacter gnavus]|uniref:ATP-grasp domain-containing protein n=1 Tax=Mediterraneibacter gnavus TaxID=33038 RepID=UPI00232DDA3E|nr:ATP-grasp domain-containing protein [Mediterraneibacter gnavus]MDB8711941.1 ATP-grasp domain-containing protein [Mediterraneibacter gnavus]MDB8714965.1 ATP-grasp domain-containing protein [Mediterraneibacter gnavus]
MKKVLILGVASVQMDAVLQLKEMKCETFTCAMAKDGPAADVSDHFEIINILDENMLIEYIKKNSIDVVYSTGSDLAMPIACRISEKLGMPHFVSSQTAYACNHKNEMRLRLSTCKGNIPFKVAETLEDIKDMSMHYPLILKPSDSQGQRGIFLVTSDDEIIKYFNEAKKYSREGKVIIEKYIDGPEISVNGYMVNGKLEYMMVSDRDTWPEYTGLIHKHIIPAQTLEIGTNQKIRNIFQEACNCLGILNGPAYFQIKLENQTPYIIEMTPRLDGCHMWNLLNRATGINLMKLVFEHLLYNDVSELKRQDSTVKPMELVFFCQKPNLIMDCSSYSVPEDAVDSFFYYRTGDYVRPVNGKFDKVGYYIHNLRE